MKTAMALLKTSTLLLSGTKRRLIMGSCMANTSWALYETQEEVKDLQKAIYWYQEAANNNIEQGNGAAERLNREGYYVDDKHKGITCRHLIF
jgi:TPR repeat protein